MLHDVRVIELSSPETMLAGRILADLGADVIVVEPPAGAQGRRLGPFKDDMPGLERSLTWHALNRNKRALTLDLTSTDGRDLLAQLGRNATVVLQAQGEDGTHPADAIHWPDTSIRCQITAFGREGPKSAYRKTDLIVAAASGVPGITGVPDRPPLFLPVPQAMMEAGAEAAIGALAALIARDRDTLGQVVDVSARIAAMMSALSVPISVPAGNPNSVRATSRTQLAGVNLPGTYVCKDGFVLISLALGPAFGPMTKRLMQWAAEQGCVSARIAELDWPAMADLVQRGEVTAADIREAVDGIIKVCGKTSKADLGAVARERGLLMAEISDMKDVADSVQYRERGLWADVPGASLHPNLKDPARFAQFSNYQIEITRPAPELSQHTAAILEADLHLSSIEIQALFVHGII
jgi:crotonobetainyl-CoA:carnitine CoA-transferase CaiB-like acyl-CoA transferase